MSAQALSVVRKPAVKQDRVTDSVTLDHAARADHHRDVTTEKGVAVHIHLHGVGMLRDGDALKLENDALVLVKAATESLYEIRATNAARMARLAWRLGGAHVPMEATADALYVLADPALDELIRSQGAMFSPAQRAFEPESDGGHHHHGHGHDHHAHEHHHEHAHDHHHAHDHTHKHGRG